MADEYKVNTSVRYRVRDDALDANGAEILDPVPMAPPLGFKKDLSMFDHMRNMIRSEHVRLAALATGHETFEEADDFDIDEDDDPSTPYEENFDPVDSDARMRLRQEDYDARVRARLEELQPVVRRKPNARSSEGSRGDSSGRNDDDPGGPGQPKERDAVKPNADEEPDA